MAGQRKRYSTELKTKVALEAMKGQRTANEIAAEYGVHPTPNCAMEEASTRWLARCVLDAGE